MTTVTQIITDAYRQSNLVAIGASPTTAQIAEALRYLNRIVKSVFGTEIGENFQPLPIGSGNYTRPTGFPYEDPTNYNWWYVPENTNAVLNLTAATTLYLHPEPKDGARFAITDAGGNLATYNVTINGNGRKIENTASVIVSTSSIHTEWFYRADLGCWKKYATLIEADTFPFPEEFDDFFITELAMRVNPAHGHSVDEQSVASYKRAKTQLRARYAQGRDTRVELGLLRREEYFFDESQKFFNQGRPV